MRSGTGYWSPTMLSAHSCTRLSGVGGMLHQQVVVGLFQQFGARYVIVLFRKASKREAMPFFGDACNALGKSMMRRHSSRPKLPNRKKASRGAVAIQLVAAPCVQHGTGGFLQTLVCHVYQAVLQFERTDRFHFLSKSFVSISSSLGSLFIVFSHSANNLCSCGILFLSLLEINRPIYVSFSSDSC